MALSDDLALLSDHAHCEKKAAASAIGLIARYYEQPLLVSAMASLAQEEMAHFEEVHGLLVARGGTLGADNGDPYVKALLASVRGIAKHDKLLDRLLISSLIEARSCHRLQLLAANHTDPELAEMFARLVRSEGQHAHQFVDLARQLVGDREPVDERLAELVDIEQAIIDSTPIRCAIH